MGIEHMTPVTFSSISACGQFSLAHISCTTQKRGLTVLGFYRGLAPGLMLQDRKQGRTNQGNKGIRGKFEIGYSHDKRGEHA